MLKNTNSKIRYTLTIILCSVLLTACSNSPKIISATESKVILEAKPEPEVFLDAYDIAQKKCTTDERIAYATYIADSAESLDKVTFNCFDPNAEVLAEEQTETAVENELDSEVVPEETVQ